MKISIGSDHGGLDLKKYLVAKLMQEKMEVIDFGTSTYDSCDYPDFAYLVAKSVSKGEVDFGIVICTTGIGVSIVANKVLGVRAALIYNEDAAELTRQHNDANVLALGAKYLNNELAWSICQKFLQTKFLGDRHLRRVNKITTIDEEERFLKK